MIPSPPPLPILPPASCPTLVTIFPARGMSSLALLHRRGGNTRRGTPRRQGRNRPRAIYRRHSLFACERIMGSRRWCRSVGGTHTENVWIYMKYWISLRKEFSHVRRVKRAFNRQSTESGKGALNERTHVIARIRETYFWGLSEICGLVGWFIIINRRKNIYKRVIKGEVYCEHELLDCLLKAHEISRHLILIYESNESCRALK